MLNPKYFNADNAALPSRQPSSVNVLDVAAAPAASAASAASGTSVASPPSSLKPAARAPVAKTAGTILAASIAHSAPTHEVRQLSLAELLAAAAMGHDPATYKEAMGAANAEEWTEVCQYEMDALWKNDTWELVKLPPSRKAVKSRWVFRLKMDGRHHARVVAKGFMQIPDIDYDETFSPVAHFESLQLLLVLAALENWEIHQMDVKSAFLNGVLNEEIYMEQQQGFIAARQVVLPQLWLLTATNQQP